MASQNAARPHALQDTSTRCTPTGIAWHLDMPTDAVRGKHTKHVRHDYTIVRPLSPFPSHFPPPPPPILSFPSLRQQTNAAVRTANWCLLGKAFLEGRLEELDFGRVLNAGHGLSILVTAGVGCQPSGGQPPEGQHGNAGHVLGEDSHGGGGGSGSGLCAGALRHTLLFDGGPRPELWEGNAAKLALDLRPLEAVVLSHWCDAMAG